jgi:hypothetical protein
MPRSPAEAIRLESRRSKVAELYMRGMRSLTRIAQELNVDKAQISRDFKHIRKMWRETCIQDIHVAHQEELAKIDEIEQKAWAGWERSCQPVETMEVIGTAQGAKSKPEKVRKITKGQSGNPRFLQVVLECVSKRCELLSLYHLDLHEKVKSLEERDKLRSEAGSNSSNGNGTTYWRN